MEKESDRSSSPDEGFLEDSPHSSGYSTLRDKKNRPFKALTPKRLEKDAIGIQGTSKQLQSLPKKSPRPTFEGKLSSRVIPSVTKNERLLSRSKAQPNNRLQPLDNPFLKVEDEKAHPGKSTDAPKNPKAQLCTYIHKNEFGADHVYKGPYGTNFVTYLDYTASGRPLRCIEAYIQRYVLPTYANTHTEVSHNAIQTTIFREDARGIIRKSVNANDDDCIIFTGSGVTAAINKIVHCLKLELMGSVVVFIGPYEHHSNILPWLHSKAKVIRIPQDKDGLFDIKTLAVKLEEVTETARRTGKPAPFIIGSFSAASNVTGILTPTYPISCLMHRYNGIVLWDYACAGPYVPIDMNPEQEDPNSDEEPYKDAVFISPHKFLGGPGTPGILIAKKWLFQNPVPHDTGGGTVLFVRRAKHVYISNPEHREEGGTPAIVESIRCGLVFKLKDTVGPKYIMKKEQGIFRKAVTFLQEIDGLVLLGNTKVHRLPIISFLLYNTHTGRFLHHDFVATVFNELFGIQVRSGCACAGPYGLDLMGMSEEWAEKFEKLLTVPVPDNSKKPSSKFVDRENIVFQNAIFKPGFVRLNLPYFLSDNCLDFVLKAVRLMALHCWSLLPQYRCDVEKGGWTNCSGQMTAADRRHLDEVSFTSGAMKVKQPTTSFCRKDELSPSSSSESVDAPEVNYSSILKRAEGVFYDAMSGVYDCDDDNTAGVTDDLMWFVTPKEAADIIHRRKTRSKLKPENLPFMPGGLAIKLGISPVGHQSRGTEMDRKFIMEYHTFQKEKDPNHDKNKENRTVKEKPTYSRALN